MRKPGALLFDYGGTLVEEVSYDMRAGIEAILAHASHRRPEATFERIVERATRIANEVASLRNEYHLETPWPTLTRLIHDHFGTRFDRPMPELEMMYWRASVVTREMPGARAALGAFHSAGIPMGVVSNSSFGPDVIGYELAKHGLTDHLAFVMVSADYAVRKPHPLLFELAATKLGVAPADIWFVGDRVDTDIAGARRAGMTTVLFRPSGSEAHDEVDTTVATWEQLAGLVGLSQSVS